MLLIVPLLMLSGIAQGLEVLLPSDFVPKRIDSPPFSRFIGPQEGCKTIAELVRYTNTSSVGICDQIDAGYHQEKVVLVHDLVYSARKQDDGCSFEDIYWKFYNDGALGVIVVHDGATPGISLNIHGNRNSAIDGTMAFLAVEGNQAMERLLERADGNGGVVVRLHCVDPYPWIVWVNGVELGFHVFVGGVYFLLTVFLGLKLMLTPTPSTRQRSVHVKMLAIVFTFTAIQFPLHLFGLAGPMNTSIIGDDVVTYPLKAWLKTNVAGLFLFVLAYFSLGLYHGGMHERNCFHGVGMVVFCAIVWAPDIWVGTARSEYKLSLEYSSIQAVVVLYGIAVFLVTVGACLSRTNPKSTGFSRRFLPVLGAIYLLGMILSCSRKVQGSPSGAVFAAVLTSSSQLSIILVLVRGMIARTSPALPKQLLSETQPDQVTSV